MNHDTVIPTTTEGVAFEVVLGDKHVHLTRTDAPGSLGALLPADARRLAALLIGAAAEVDPEGTAADIGASSI